MTLRRNVRSKHVRIKVHANAEVEVVVPRDFDERDLPAILDKHENWVEERLSSLDIRVNSPLSPPTTLYLAAINERWRLEYFPGTARGSICREGPNYTLQIFASDPEAIRQTLRRWLARKAKRHLVPWLLHTSEELTLPFSGISVRCQRTRWGSCSAQGRINLNYALLFLAPELVRYLFVHELCHTVHLNHSTHYWALVEHHEPQFRQLRKRLKQATGEVPRWLHQSFSRAL